MKQSAMVHQAIHGYRGGHRLLAASLDLDRDTARTLLIMSDISGPAMYPGFETYITGYPLAGLEMYVLARTWHAPEMKRPGCVWTHSLLINQKDLGGIQDATALTERFRRPQVDDIAHLTVNEIEIPIAARQTAPNPQISRFGWLPAVVESVYGADCVPTSLLADSAVDQEQVILRLWLQGWGAIRSTFTFCTGSLSDRHFHDVLLDFQVVPKQIDAMVLRKLQRETTVCMEGRPSAGVTIEPWVDIVVQEIILPGRNIARKWLHEVAAAETSRSIMGPLLRAYESIYRWSPPAPREAIEELQVLLGNVSLHEETTGALLKMLLGLYETAAENSKHAELLHYLSVNSSISVFDPVRDKVNEIAVDIFHENPFTAVKFIQRTIDQRLSKIGEETLLSAIDAIEIDHALQLFESHPEFVPILLRRKPSLATSDRLWRTANIDRRAVIVAVIESHVLGTREILASVARHLFVGGIDDVAHELMEMGGDPVIASVIDAYRSATGSMAGGWRFELQRRVEEIIEYLVGEPTKSERDLVLLTEIANPNDSMVSSECARIYESYLHYQHEAEEADTTVAAFGIALAFAGPNRIPFVVAFFQTVHDALESGTLPSYAWSWLSKHAPAVSWWREWDRCERISVAVVKKIQEEGAEPEVFLRTIQSKTAIEHAFLHLRESKRGRKYLKEIRNTLQELPELGNSEQHRKLG